MGEPGGAGWQRLDLPWLHARIDDYEVLSWSVSVGDSLAFGDPICVVSAGKLQSQPSEDRGNVQFLSRRRRRRIDRERENRDRVGLEAQVVAAEPGVVVQILTPAGAMVAPGTPMALLSREQRRDDPPPVDQLNVFRAEADWLGGEAP